MTTGADLATIVEQALTDLTPGRVRPARPPEHIARSLGNSAAWAVVVSGGHDVPNSFGTGAVWWRFALSNLDPVAARTSE